MIEIKDIKGGKYHATSFSCVDVRRNVSISLLTRKAGDLGENPGSSLRCGEKHPESTEK